MISATTEHEAAPLLRSPVAYHALLLGTFMAASAAPTPMYRLYQEYFAISPGMVAIIFAIYVLALLITLLTVGSVSDQLGRRPVIFGSIVIEIVAMALFWVAEGPYSLMVARVVQGVATAIAGSSIAAALSDFDRARGQTVNSITLLGGMAIGAFGTSALIQFAPEPLRLTFGLMLVFFVLEAAAIWLTPETVVRRRIAPSSLLPRLAVPPNARRAFASVTPFHIANWMLGGFYLSLVPSVVVAATGSRAPLTGGSVVTALLVAGTLTNYLRRNKSPLQNLKISVIPAVLGMATVILGVHLGNVPLLFIGTVLSGTGFGLNFLGCMASVVPHAKPEERAELISALYTLGYLSFSLPAIGAGFLVNSLGYGVVSDLYGAAVLGLNVTGMFFLRREAALKGR